MASSKSSKGKSKGDPNQKIKLAVALVCLVVAGIALAWNAGAFDFSPTPAEVAAQEEAVTPPEVKEQRKKEIEQVQEAQRQAERRPGTTKHGG
ncbi:MAG: hypothetical protein ACT4PL_03445 [Phycisphaerales bacterium]